MKVKYRSGLNKVLIGFVVAFNIVIVLLFLTKIFTNTMLGVNVGFFLLFWDIVLVLPMLFFTYYELRDDYLYIHDYPIRAYKIKYEDIFNVEDGDFTTKNKSIVALSMDRIAIGYKKTNSDDSVDERYIFVSPAEMSLFLLKLSGKLQNNKQVFEEKAKQISERQAEHEKKKKQAEKKKAEGEKDEEPEVIQMSGVKKFSGFKMQSSDDKSEDSQKDGGATDKNE